MKFLAFVFSLCFLVVLSVEAKKRPKRYNAVVYLTDNSSYKGILEKVSAGGLTIDYYGTSKFINAGKIESVRIKKAGTLTKSVVVGAAAGLLVGYGIYEKEVSTKTIQEGASFPVVVVGTALIGSGIVALINSFLPRKHYRNLQQAGEYKKIIAELRTYAVESLQQ